MAFQRQIAFECEADLPSPTPVWCLQGQGCWPQVPSVLKQREKKRESHEIEFHQTKNTLWKNLKNRSLRYSPLLGRDSREQPSLHYIRVKIAEKLEFFHKYLLFNDKQKICSLAEREKWKKVLDFLETTGNISVINILLILNPKHSSHWDKNSLWPSQKQDRNNKTFL